MKALSIKQPWAWLICKGYKDIENRAWRIGRNPRHGPFSSRDIDNFSINLPERVYIHASKIADWGEETEDFLYRLFNADIPYGIPRTGTHSEQFGAIIGEIDITSCVTESTSPWFVGPYGFTLANPVLYEKPIPYRGQLGFFEVVSTVISSQQQQSLGGDR